jgi:hypothetical protein
MLNFLIFLKSFPKNKYKDLPMALALVFSAVTQCKKVYDVSNNIRKVPEEAYYLWQQLDALEPIVVVASQLNTHEATWRVVNKSLEAVYEVVVQCDVLLTRSEPDGRPTEAESWSEWWSTVPRRATERVSRVALIPKLTQRLHVVVSLLQAALSAALLVQREREMTLRLAASDGSSASATSRQWKWPVPSIERARRIFHLFEGGRLEVCGNQYQLGQGVLFSRKDGAAKNCLGSVALILRRKVRDATSTPPLYGYEMLFVNAADIGEMIASQTDATEMDGGNSTLAAARLVQAGGHSGRAPPKIEAVVDFYASGHMWKTSCVTADFVGNADVNNGPTITFRKFASVSGGSASALCLFEVQSFTSCFLPSQLCHFPSSSESYHHVTLEVAHLLSIFCAAIAAKASVGQVDAALPVVVDAESSTAERDELETFLSAKFI